MAARARQPHHRAGRVRINHQPAVEVAARGIAEDDRQDHRMRRIALYRLLVIVGVTLLLEALCLLKVIDRITMPPPHQILRDFGTILISGKLNAAIAKTMTNASIAVSLAIVVGVLTA